MAVIEHIPRHPRPGDQAAVLDWDIHAGASHRVGRDAASPAGSDLRAPFISWSDFWTKDRTEVEWVYDNVLAKGRGHSMHAKHKVGKSLLALYIVKEVATDGRNAVLYLDYEMSEDDIYERLSDMGCGPETDLTYLYYAMLPTLPPLDTEAGGKALATLIDEVQALAGDRHLVVVIDTFSRVVTGKENENDTTQAFYRHSGLEMKRRGLTWVRLDHEGHDGGHPRGNSAKGDDIDVAWRLKATNGGLEMTRYAARMSWVPEKVSLRMTTEPFLAFDQGPPDWPAGTDELAATLDRLGVPLDSSTRAAQAALREHGAGKAARVVRAAVKKRRLDRDPPRDPPPTEDPGRTPGPGPTVLHRDGQDPLPDAAGPTFVASGSRSGVPLGGPRRPGPIDEGVEHLPAALASRRL